MLPFNVVVDLATGVMSDGETYVRRLSNMEEFYNDAAEASRMVAESDPALYEVCTLEVPEEDGHLIQCVSTIYPGKVGDEFFMTKGHYHEERGTAEIYLCIAGRGKLVMETEDEQCKVLDMFPGSSSYIPPGWAHRSVNIGNSPLVLYCVYPGHAGHDYGTIRETGFRKLVVDQDGWPVVVDNPKHAREE